MYRSRSTLATPATRRLDPPAVTPPATRRPVAARTGEQAAHQRGRPDPAPQARPRRSRRPDRGQATAELALGLPTLGAIIIVALWLLAAVGAQARVDEAARIGARAAARGEADGQVAAWVRGAAPAGATVEIARRDDQVAVTVHYRLAAAGPLVTPLALTATATAPSEQAITDAASADVASPARVDAAAPPPDNENKR